MTRLSILFASLFAGAAFAQETVSDSKGDIRVLDKLNGTVTDLTMAVGSAEAVGNLRLSLQDCRSPAGNPNGDAFALLTILYQGETAPVFQGWMIASAPALNAMDHPRYDVWVLSCQS